MLEDFVLSETCAVPEVEQARLTWVSTRAGHVSGSSIDLCPSGRLAAVARSKRGVQGLEISLELDRWTVLGATQRGSKS